MWYFRHIHIAYHHHILFRDCKRKASEKKKAILSDSFLKNDCYILVESFTMEYNNTCIHGYPVPAYLLDRVGDQSTLGTDDMSRFLKESGSKTGAYDTETASNTYCDCFRMNEHFASDRICNEF